MRIVFFAALACAAVPVLAEPGDKTKSLDPNQVICRSEPTIGSRLSSQRTCLTRIQWKQQQDEQRKTVDRIQNQRALPGGG